MITIEPQSAPYQRIEFTDLPSLIKNFVCSVDVKTLKEIIEQHLKSTTGGPTLTPLYLSKRFVVGLLSAILVEDGVLQVGIMEHFTDTLFLMKYYTEIYVRSNQAERDRLWGMLRAAVSKIGDARRFFFEIATAFIYADYECSVTLTDLSNAARFEFLIEKNGYKFEAEVKTISSLARHALSGAAFDAFATVVQKTLKGLRFPYPENQLHILVSGIHEKAAKAINDFHVCSRELRQGEQRVRHGCIRIGIKSVPKSDVDSIEAFVNGQELRMPRHLEQYPALSMIETSAGRAFSSISFSRPWRISKTFEKDLDDAFSKFSGNHPAVVWLYLTDATPFSINPFRREIGILRNADVNRVIERYRAKGRYSYPTGIVISSNLFSTRLPDDPNVIKMINWFLFRPSRGAAIEHGIVTPLQVRAIQF